MELGLTSLPSQFACVPSSTSRAAGAKIAPWIKAASPKFLIWQSKSRSLSVVSQLSVGQCHAQTYEEEKLSKKERSIMIAASQDRHEFGLSTVDTLSPAGRLPIEQNLLMELAKLKVQLKEKKQELKARKKEMKGEKKLNKVKEPKAKKCVANLISSVNESTDSHDTVNMTTLGEGGPGNTHNLLALASGASQVVDRGEEETKALRLAKYKHTQSHVKESEHVEVETRIEVCMGSKCKRAGSQALLDSLQERVRSGYDVCAVGCKCMGRCGMPINVRVLKEERDEQVHSHVSVEDDEELFLLRNGVGVGARASPAGLERFGERQVNLQPA